MPDFVYAHAMPVIARNTILSSLRPEDLAFLRPYLYPAKFRERAVLQRVRKRIENIGFLEMGVISLRRTSKDNIVELGLIGNQGMVGCSRLLGATDLELHRVCCGYVADCCSTSVVINCFLSWRSGRE